MLRALEPLRYDTRIEGRVDSFDGWSRTTIDVDGSPAELRQLRLLLGDETTGPVILIGSYTPIPSKFWGGLPDGLAHLHRSDSFRMEVDDRPESFFKMGPQRIHFGEYYVLPANTIYTDPPGPNGSTAVLFFADRRGAPAVNKRTRSCGADTLRQRSSFGEALPIVHTSNDDAVSHLATTFLGSIPPRGFSGSLFDDSRWTQVSDGSRIAALFMGDPVSGPMVLLSQNSAAATESPAGSYATETFRMILRGSCTVGDRTYEPFEFSATEAGAPHGTVVHGSEGSTQLLFFADRRGWRPTEDAPAHNGARRLEEVADCLAPMFDAIEQVL